MYSNKPWLLRNNSQLIAPGCNPLWFPENEMDLIGIQQLASGYRPLKDQIVVTNSLMVLRAFQMTKGSHPNTVVFIYVEWPWIEVQPNNVSFILHMNDNLEAMEVPQLDWEIYQAAQYLQLHGAHHA